jgi:uncharacterized protein YggE
LTAAQPTRLYDDRPKITVHGDAVVNVQPDRIVINLGIETSDKDIEVAKQKNGDLHKKVVAAIRECGVPSKEIQTDQLSIEPRYTNDYRKENFIGYFVRNTIVATLNDPAKVEELISKTLRSGVTHLHGVDFQTTEFKKHREQARELALQAAKEKAEKMAGVLGRAIGNPLDISEGSSPWWYHSSWSGWGFGRLSGMSQNVVQNVDPAGGGGPDSLALGKIAIRANVTVTFELLH